MRIAMTLLALSLALTSVAGCKKKKAADTGMASGTATMTGSDTTGSAGSGSDTTMAGSGSAGAGSGSDTMAGSGSAGGDDTMQKKAGNCPSTVFGSTTKAEIKGKDVLLTITSDDKDAIASIQRRTEELLAEKADGAGSGGGAHDQKGSHGGAKGICPVYWDEGGKAVSKKDAKGVVITITPKAAVDELKKLIDERITKTADYVKENVKAGDAGTGGGVGGGKGDHGGNHSGSGDGKGKERKDGTGGGAGTGGGGGKGTGAGSGAGSGSAK